MNKSILFITPHFYPRLGGVETHVYKVTKELIKKGWKVTVLTQASKPLKNTAQLGFKIIQLPVKDPLDKNEVWNKLSRFSTQFGHFDIIHVHDVVWWVWPWLIKLRKKLFITYHGWEGDYPVTWKAKLQRLFFSLFAQGTVHIGDFIQEFYWDTPSAVTYGGVDHKGKTVFFMPNKNHPRFVFLGRLEKENAITYYVDFFSKLKSIGITPVITWVGDGSYRNVCETLGTVTGMVKNTGLYLAHADFVCANSYLSIMEAQAEGKIVLSFYQHSLKQRYLETYPGSRYIILAKDPKTMVSKIRKLLKNVRQLKSLSSSSQQFTLTRTWDKVADVYEKLWQTSI